MHIIKNTNTAIIGNNGSGKSTIINIICNLFPCSEGIVYFNNRKIEPKYHSYKRNIGFVLCCPFYIKEFDIITYWSFVAKFHKIDADTAHQRMDDLLKELDLTKEGNKKISSLSAGNQLKTSIGAMLLHNPETLVMDEPFANLDINTIALLQKMFILLRGKKTIIITSHQIDLVADICDNFVILEKGVIKEEFCRGCETEAVIHDKIRVSLEKKIEFNLGWLMK